MRDYQTLGDVCDELVKELRLNHVQKELLEKFGYEPHREGEDKVLVKDYGKFHVAYRRKKDGYYNFAVMMQMLGEK